MVESTYLKSDRSEPDPPSTVRNLTLDVAQAYLEVISNVHTLRRHRPNAGYVGAGSAACIAALFCSQQECCNVMAGLAEPVKYKRATLNEQLHNY